MKFYANQYFHIYNQGNNKRQIFFSAENYQYFLWKMRAYLLPFGDFIAWSLMPNHYHWLFYVKQTEIIRKEARLYADSVEYQRRLKKYGSKAIPVDNKDQRNADENAMLTFNEAIGRVEQSYTNALNIQQNWTGSLFRKRAKAKDGWIDEFVTLEKNGKTDFRFTTGNSYTYQCLCYIHKNATTTGIVQEDTEYEWSSAKDYAGLRRGSLCNLEMGRQLQNFI